MAIQELVAGLRNAIDRGASLEKAKQSFISAGYPIQEIEEAAKFVSSGVPSITEEIEAPDIPRPTIVNSIKPGGSIQQPPHGFFSGLGKHWKLFSLLGVLLVLIVIFVIFLLVL